MQLSETLLPKFRISCRLPQGRGLSCLAAYEWQKGRAYSMLELTSSRLCTNDFVTWPQYTFGLSLLLIVSANRCFVVDGVVLEDSATSSSIPSSIAVVQTDAREPTDVLAKVQIRTAATGADVPARAQVVVVPPPFPATDRISEMRAFVCPHRVPLLLATHSRPFGGRKRVRETQITMRRETRIALRRISGLPFAGSNFSSLFHRTSDVARTANRCPADSLMDSRDDRAVTFWKSILYVRQDTTSRIAGWSGEWFQLV